MSAVILRRIDTGATIVGQLGDDDTITGGVGGWDSLDRPRDTSAVSWTGTPPKTYTLPFLLDGIEARLGVDVSVEPQCTRLVAWGRGNREAPPPVLQVIGTEVLVDVTDRWVLQDLAWGDRDRSDDGQRVRQSVTLTLLEHVAPVLLTSPAKKARHHQANGGAGSNAAGGGSGNGGGGNVLGVVTTALGKWPDGRDARSSRKGDTWP